MRFVMRKKISATCLLASLMGSSAYALDGAQHASESARSAVTQGLGGYGECPRELISRVKYRDKGALNPLFAYSGFTPWSIDFGTNASAKCSKKLTDTLVSAPGSLEAFLASNGQTKMGLAPNWLAGCLSQSGLKPGSTDYNAVVADYYVTMTKLKKASEAAMEAVAATDALLGDRPGTTLQGSALLPGSGAKAAQLRTCKAEPDEFKKVASSIRAKLVELQRLAPLAYDNNPLTPQAQKADAKKKLDALLASIPWSQGTAMANLITACQVEAAPVVGNLVKGAADALVNVSKTFGWAKKDAKAARCTDPASIEGTLRQQLRDNRSALTDYLKSLRSASECVNGKGDRDCYQSDFFKRSGKVVLGQHVRDPIDTIAALPALDANQLRTDLSLSPGMPQMKSVGPEIARVLDSAECRIHQRKRIEDRARVGSDIGIFVGAAALGMGIGATEAVFGRATAFALGLAHDGAWAAAGIAGAANACREANFKDIETIKKAEVQRKSGSGSCDVSPAEYVAAVTKLDECLMMGAGAAVGVAAPMAAIAGRAAGRELGAVKNAAAHMAEENSAKSTTVASKSLVGGPTTAAAFSKGSPLEASAVKAVRPKASAEESGVAARTLAKPAAGAVTSHASNSADDLARALAANKNGKLSLKISRNFAGSSSKEYAVTKGNLYLSEGAQRKLSTLRATNPTLWETLLGRIRACPRRMGH